MDECHWGSSRTGISRLVVLALLVLALLFVLCLLVILSLVALGIGSLGIGSLGIGALGIGALGIGGTGILVGVLVAGLSGRVGAGILLSAGVQRGDVVPTTAPRDMQAGGHMEGEGAHEDLPQRWLGNDHIDGIKKEDNQVSHKKKKRGGVKWERGRKDRSLLRPETNT